MTDTPYQGIIFDFDGTLADTRAAITACITDTFTHYHQPQPTPEAIQRTIGSTLHDSLTSLGAPPADIDAWVTTYRQIYTTHGPTRSTPYPELAATLTTLHHADIHLAIASNKGSKAIEAFLAVHHINHTNHTIFAADTTAFTKPDPQLLHRTILPAWPHLTPETILMIGDTPTDITFAHATGMHAAWITHGYGNPSQCRALQPQHTINHLNEIPHLRRSA